MIHLYFFHLFLVTGSLTFAPMKQTYGRNFWLLCLSMFLFMTSFNLILPELNSYITDLGGAKYKGLIFTLFTISAGLSRPFSGKLSDTIGRKKVMLIGIFIACLVGLFYPLRLGILFFLFLRFLHGFCAGFMPTGATATITDMLPIEKRGKGMGIWGTFISLGIGVGQFFGSPIRDLIGIDGLFYFSSFTAVCAGAILLYIEETLVDKQLFKRNLLVISWKDVFERTVLPAALVMFLSAISSGIIFVLTPDISVYLGIDNKGWFFAFYVISTIGVRLFSGAWSDKYGRRKVLLVGVTILIISMIGVGLANSPFAYTLSSMLFGCATGITSPTLFAWMADLSHHQRRGVGAGTLFIALEAGIFMGSLITLVTYDNSSKSVLFTFAVGAFCALIAMFYLIWHLRTQSSKT